MSSFGCIPFSIISDLASISDESKIGKAPVFAQFSLVSPNVTIGDFIHLNYFSSVSHDSSIRNFATIGPGARINGDVLVEDHVYVGAQATILPGTKNKKNNRKRCDNRNGGCSYRGCSSLCYSSWKPSENFGKLIFRNLIHF